MATIVLPNTRVDTQWFDANPVMQNFNAIKNAVNGMLDGQNVNASSNITVSSLSLNSSLQTQTLNLTGNVTVQLNSSTGFSIRSSATVVFCVYSPNQVGFIGRFDTLPVGSILQFDSAWTNNVTMPGWYQCDGNNGTVNLVNKFIYSGSASGATGGTNDAVVIEHGHTGSTGTELSTHTHAVSGTSASNTDPHTHTADPPWGSNTSNSNYISRALGPALGSNTTGSSAPSHSHSLSGSSGDNSAAHTHTVTVNNAGLASGSNMPAYYSMIFIQRVS
jgi:hypothetical protein